MSKMSFGMTIHFSVEADDPADAWKAEELKRGFEEACEDALAELEAPAELDDSLGVDLGAAIARTLADFVQLKRRALARTRRPK